MGVGGVPRWHHDILTPATPRELNPPLLWPTDCGAYGPLPSLVELDLPSAGKKIRILKLLWRAGRLKAEAGITAYFGAFGI